MDLWKGKHMNCDTVDAAVIQTCIVGLDTGSQSQETQKWFENGKDSTPLL